MSGYTHRPAGAPDAHYRGPNRALILAGGGMRIAYQVGVIRALVEEGLCFRHIDATSGGIVNLAMLLSGLTPGEMCEHWRTLDAHDFAHLMPLMSYLKSDGSLSLGRAENVQRNIFPHLGIDVLTIRSAQDMLGTFNVCNYTRKTNEVIEHTAIDMDLLVAGISPPIFMPPIEKQGNLYMDAVWIKSANVIDAVQRGAEELWIVWCIGNSSEYKTGLFHQYVHMTELSANGKLFEEFAYVQELNERILRGEEGYGQRQPVRLHIIKPIYPLPLDSDLYFGRVDVQMLIDAGYADAHRYLQTMSEAGLPFQPEVTHMQEDVAGIAFHEEMRGPFMLGVIDPQSGAVQGKNIGAEMRLSCTVNIQAVDHFTLDPQHTGEISGHISYPPLMQYSDAERSSDELFVDVYAVNRATSGQVAQSLHIPITRGIFNLFSPDLDHAHRYIIYELAFIHEGQNYYLAGYKEVHEDALHDIWRDTTTLYTQLHRGTDKTGPVIGAGILTIDAVGLRRTIASMHTIHIRSPFGQIETLLKFGRFFLGDLWDTYGPESRK